MSYNYENNLFLKVCKNIIYNKIITYQDYSSFYAN